MSYIKVAKRENIPLKLGMRGASGSGKTYSSILLAKGLMGGSLEKVCILDTENKSANLYADLAGGGYSVAPLEAPFSPKRYVDAINYIYKEGFECLIIDSTSHEWMGPGGCLDMHSKIPGNSYTAWNKVTPMHDAFIHAILQTPMHVICNMRSKEDYVLAENEKGKVVPEKVGTKPLMRDGFEFELTCNFNLDERHQATMSKDRTSLFDDGIPFQITEETGAKIRQWNNIK
jgi:hypothetical protein